MLGRYLSCMDKEKQMEFDRTNKVIVDTMNFDEAKAFVMFLESEITRHERDVEDALKLIMRVKSRFKIRSES